MNHQQSRFHALHFIAVTVGLSIGCSGALTTDETASAVAPAPEGVVASGDGSLLVTVAMVDLGKTRVSFIEGSGALGIVEQGTGPETAPIGQLLTRNLTTLEMYLALAPSGANPPAALVQRHPVEATALGRADASVRHVQIDLNAPVPKSYSACTQDIFTPIDQVIPGVPSPGSYIHRTNDNNLTGAHLDYLTGHSSYSTTSWVTLGACSDSVNGSDVAANFWYQPAWDSNPWHSFCADANLPCTMGRGGWLHFYLEQSFTHGCTEFVNICLGDCQFTQPSFLGCPAQFHGAHYAVSGSSASPYALKLGEWVIEPPH